MCGPCTAAGTPWQLAAFIAGADPGDKPAVAIWLEDNRLLEPGSNNGGAGTRIVATYPYQDETGCLRYEVVRVEPGRNGRKKSFFQRRPNGNGGWVNSLEGVRRIPYRLPELLKAEYIHVVEGEKDVEALRAIGLQATTMTGGAAASAGPDGAKRTAEFAAFFKPHQHAVIIPDNDDPGNGHAQRIAEALAGRAGSLKMLNLPGLGPKGDVSDFIGKDPDGAAEELARLAEAAPEWQPTTVETALNFEPPAYWKVLDVAYVREWECASMSPIVDGWLARGNLGFIAAQSQTGKTLFGLYLFRKLLHGGKLFGRYEITPVDRLGYFLLEDPDRRAQDRILDTEHEFAESPLAPGRFFVHVTAGFTLTDPRMFEWMERVIVTDKLDIVALDTYQKATPGISSFDDEKQGEVLHKLASLTRKLGITILVMDHFRKEGNGGGKAKRRELTIDDLKGTGGKAQNADVVVLLERTADRKQIKFQAFSKDFDNPIRMLLNVAPKGSKEPKFMYVADLDALGVRPHGNTEERRKTIVASMTPGEWLSIAEIAKASRTDKKGEKTLQRDLTLLGGRELDVTGEKKARRYRRRPGAIGQTV
jgi:putative DNA primase/helicase